MKLRVAIVEPSTIVAEGIELLLSRGGDYDVVCNVRTMAEYMSRRGGEADIVLLSLQYAREDVGRATKIGIQTSLADSDTLRQTSAVVSLYSSEDELHKILREAVDASAQSAVSESHEVAERERDVLVLVAKGYTNKEIATELFISPHTVISHRKNIVHKTGIRSVAGLTVYAVLNKLIDSEQL